MSATARRRGWSVAAYAAVAWAAAAVSPAAAQEQSRWRDSSPQAPEVRRHWDELEGKPAPDFAKLDAWKNTEGRSLADFRGKVVLLDYWATWCQPCVAGIPHLKELNDRYSRDGLVILGVHSSRGWESMDAFAEKRELTYALAADPSRDLGEKLGIKFIPAYFVIDRSGTMRVAGADRDHLEDILKTVLAEPYEPAPGDAPAPAQAAAAPAAAWPAPVEKQLYANDFRGKPAPEFAVAEWLTDEPSRDGKVVMIDFWATWCPPCREAIKELNELQHTFKDDLVVIGVSDESRATITKFMKSTKIHYAQAIDPKKAMSGQLGVQGIPHILIVSTDGVVRWQGFPMDTKDPLTEDLVRSIIEADAGVAARRLADKQESASR